MNVPKNGVGEMKYSDDPKGGYTKVSCCDCPHCIIKEGEHDKVFLLLHNKETEIDVWYCYAGNIPFRISEMRSEVVPAFQPIFCPLRNVKEEIIKKYRR